MRRPQVLVGGDDLSVLIRAIHSRIYDLEEMSRSLGFNYSEELKALKDLDELFTNEINLWKDN